MSSRVAVMNAGKVVQVGSPRELYGKPNDEFVADFLGVSNFIEGAVARADGGGVVIGTDVGTIRATTDRPFDAGRPVLVCLRPEELAISTAKPSQPHVNEFEGKMLAAAFLGDRVDHIVAIGDTEMRVRSHSSVRIKRDAAVWLTIPAEAIVVLPR